MNTLRKATVLGSLLLFGAAGCSDLVVDNQNQPDRSRALATAGDVQSLINGAYQQWYTSEHHVAGPAMIYSISSFQHSSTAANFGMLNYSKFPRIAVENSVTHADYGNIAVSWSQNYRALAALAEGLRVSANDPKIAAGMGTASLLRNRIYGRFVQGIAHGSLALTYDAAFVIDENVAVIDESGAPILLGEPVPYPQVMNAALQFLDEAIALASSPAAAGLTIDADLMAQSSAVTMPQLVALARSYKARFRANVARTPAERAAVNWSQVLVDANAGVTTDWTTSATITFTRWLGGSESRIYQWASTWQQLPYFIWGMADQDGDYQRWLRLGITDRSPVFAGSTEPVLIVTPDTRFPQGATLSEQVNNWGTNIGIRRVGTPPAATVSNAVQFSNAERGTWRWSQYYRRDFDATGGCQVGTCREVTVAEMRMLAAEAHFRMGALGTVVGLINPSRVAAGLSPADPAAPNDGNSSCVPKLADGTCGGLFEMLKWEKRMLTWGTGPYGSTWYFDGRGWGDLYQGTPLQFPIPAEQASLLNLTVGTYGGIGGQMAAPGNAKYYGTVE